MSRRGMPGSRAARLLRCGGLGLALLAAACAGDGGEGDVLEIKFGHVGPPGSLYEMIADEYARRANERLAGRARVVTFGASQLGSDATLLQKLKLGTLDLSLPSTIMSSTVDAFGLFEMPYLVGDREHMKRIEAEVFWPDLAPLAEAEGYHILAVWENGFRHLTNNVRPIVTPEDLQGIKLRTPRGIWRVKLFQTFGANPTPMPFSEVFIALQTGVMDGQENPLTQITSANLYEVQRYLSLTGHVYSPAFLTAGAQRWARLPEDVRQILEETARETQAFVHETAARTDAELLEMLRTTGIEINEADRAAFLQASQPIYEEFARSVQEGQSMIDRSLAASGG